MHGETDEDKYVFLKIKKIRLILWSIKPYIFISLTKSPKRLALHPPLLKQVKVKVIPQGLGASVSAVEADLVSGLSQIMVGGESMHHFSLQAILVYNL